MAQQAPLDPSSVLVVEEPFPPVVRHVLGEEHDDHILRVFPCRVLEEAHEGLDERPER